VGIGKAADAVDQTDYVCGELSKQIRSVGLLKFRERSVFATCETNKGLPQKLGISSSCVRSITII